MSHDNKMSGNDGQPFIMTICTPEPTVKPSFFDDPDIHQDKKIWTKPSQQHSRKDLSKTLILEGVLFRKSAKKPLFMKSCYYRMYDDHLVYYNVQITLECP